jgi:hypothetical protein
MSSMLLRYEISITVRVLQQIMQPINKHKFSLFSSFLLYPSSKTTIATRYD